ncbi:MAG: BlaI/MecI/CopY family transcriptional regulator [Bacteroidia bacterium]|nr:BlaI/MecI/CopY family transcriptional regulator [Bacteroidia bacterium]
MKTQETPILTPLELKVMNILWAKREGVVKDLIAAWPDDRVPAYNTVSTIIRILEEKGFVGHEAQGRGHRYFPLISRGKYQKILLKNVLDNVFAGSLTGLVSTLLDNRTMSPEELQALREMIDENTEP